MHLKIMLTGLGCLAGCSPAHAFDDAPVSAAYRHIEHSVRAAITASLDAAVQAQIPLTLAVHISSPRGAALHPCPQGWQWGAIQTHDWQRIHIPVQCSGQRGSWVAQVQAEADVWVLRADQPAGYSIQRRDLQQQRLRIDSPRALQSWQMLQDMQLRQPIAAGQLLVWRDLERPVYAYKGQPLEIRAQHGPITVSAAGLAPRQGLKGDTLKVRNTQSQQWVSGTLVAPGVLLVQEDTTASAATRVKVKLESSD